MENAAADAALAAAADAAAGHDVLPAAAAAAAALAAAAAGPALPNAGAPLDAPAILALDQVPPAPAVAPPGISISFQMRGVQIRNIIPHTLDLSTGSFNQWRHHMELAVEEYGVLDHLLSDAAPTPPDAEWRTIDLILKRWIYGSISRELGGMIMDNKKTARQLYVALDNVFLNNKRQRAVHLTSDLHEQRQGNLSVAQYCARLKTIADALRDCDQPASDDTLVTVLTRGLHDRHHVTSRILLSNSGRVSFDDARNILLMDEMQARATDRVASQSALIALGRGGGGGGAPPQAPAGAPRPPGIHGGIGTYGPNYGAPSSPSPNQGKSKRKRVTNHGGYAAHGAGSSQAPEQRPPWAGYVHAWPAPVPFGAARPPPYAGLLGARPPQAYMALHDTPQYAAHPSVQQAPPPYAAPPSVQQAPSYGVPPPMPSTQLLFPGPGQAWGTQPPPPPGNYYHHSYAQQHAATAPGYTGNSFEQSALIGALSDLSLQGGSGGWVADSGASTHLSANQNGSSNGGASTSLQQ